MSGRASILVEHEGRKVSLGELARITGLSYWTLWQRYYRGRRGAGLTSTATPAKAQLLRDREALPDRSVGLI